MPKLTIDNRRIEVSAGTMVIDAAELAGIYIPRFCYLAELGAVGACRVCAVKFEEGPVSGIQMSCMIEAADGMVISTTDDEAQDFRKHVIEWFMMNHPHDCPVCDEGGHCLLQDLTEACGHGIRRYPGGKRTYVDQYLGPLIQHEENRCIQCYRCSRFYQEFAGYKDLGVMGIASRVYFGRYRDGVLESPFSGNLIDICPTGVYTDKPSRYIGRRWDYERSPGICVNCSLGCNIKISARYREIVSLEARHNDDVNGAFICDRGRYGFFYANMDKRLRGGKVNGRNAVAEAGKRLETISKEYGDGAVAVAGSGRSSLETMAALDHICRVKCWRGPFLEDSGHTAGVVRTALSRLTPEIAVSMRSVESADFILAVGADPINEAPMLALAMRQAWRKGAKIVSVDCRPLDWPFTFEQVVAPPAEFSGLMENWKEEGSGSEILKLLRESRRPVIVCGTEITDEKTVCAAADLVESLAGEDRHAGLFYVLPRANTYGAVLLDEEGQTVDDLVDLIDSGEIKALVVVESDLWQAYPDRKRLAGALDRLEFLVDVDFMPSETVRRADIAISSQSVFEAGGIYINQEGRAQWSQPAHFGGTPVRITGKGGHPPRVIRPDIPGGDIAPAWKTAWWLARRQPPPTHELMIEWMVKTYSVLEPVSGINSTDARLFPAGHRRRNSETQPAGKEEEKGDFMFLPVAATFGDEALSSISPCLETYARPIELWMAESDARGLGIKDRDPVRLELPHEPLEFTLRTSDRVAPGVIVVYRRTDLFWQQFDRRRRFLVDRDQISTGYGKAT